MTTRMWGEAYRTSTVCVDSYQSGILNGRLYHRSVESGKTFQCLTQLLQEIENTLDSMNFPKAFTAVRRFAAVAHTPADAAQEEEPVGKKATFAVKVLFRQNASWQGSVTWLEGKQEQSFRSALELIFLINSALEQEAIAS